MRIDNPPKGTIEACCLALDRYLARVGEPPVVKYLDLGTHVVRLISRSAAFWPHVERQLTWALKDDAPRYDATLVIWQQKQDFEDIALALYGQFYPEKYARLRVDKLIGKRVQFPHISSISDQEISRHHPLLNINYETGILRAWNPTSNTFYYSVINLEPEVLSKQGHLFVRTFSRVLESPTSSLVHGAVVGLNGKGVLLCGLGYRGKSTLSVSALLDGFDYVSDDYLVLGNQDGVLRAWPIYSIVALAPERYWQMYGRLQADFVSNNSRKDKYLFNIAKHHERFAAGYPIALCLYPRITSFLEPSIEQGDKDIAIEEFVFSSVNQMLNAQNVEEIVKLHSFVADMPFYRLNLSPDIDKNTRCLREFLDTLE